MNLGGTKTTTRDGTIDGVPLPVGRHREHGHGPEVVDLDAGRQLSRASDAGIRGRSLRRREDADDRADAHVQLQCGRRAVRRARAAPEAAPSRERTGMRSSASRAAPCSVRTANGSFRTTWTSERATPISRGRVSAGIGYSFGWGDVIAHLPLPRLQLQVEQQGQRPDHQGTPAGGGVPLVAAGGCRSRLGSSPQVVARLDRGHEAWKAV